MPPKVSKTENSDSFASVFSGEIGVVILELPLKTTSAPAAGRAQAALLCRRWEGLLPWSAQFCHAPPDSLSDLVRRATKRFTDPPVYHNTIATLERTLGLKTGNQAGL